MSLIDKSIVELQFDNAKFEEGIKTTLASLDKLKEKLQLDDADSGFDTVQKAANSFSLSKAASAVEELTDSFKGLFTMSGRVANYIKNKVAAKISNTLLSIPKTFLSSMKSGFEEYNTQIDATQTIYVNVKKSGASLDDVTAALDELNEYADRTIYNFTQMTQNIGRFVTAGVGLTEATKAVQGLSNLSALMGANSEQNSRAMYNYSQALSKGYMGYADWMTMQNTQLGGESVQEMFIKSARAHNVNIDKMLKNSTFTETLSKKWLSSDILLDVMENLTLVTNESTEAEIQYARELLAAKGYKDEDIDYWIELAKTSSEAATKVTTYTKLIDTLMEALGSGWTKTWQLIIGDYEEASEMWTAISNELSAIVEASSDARNQILSNWDAFGGRFLLLQAGSNLWDGLKNSFGQIVSVFYKSLMGTTDLEWGVLGQNLKNATSDLRLWTKGILDWSKGTDILTGKTRMEEFAAIGQGLADTFKMAASVAKGVFGVFSKLIGLVFNNAFTDGVLMTISGIAEAISGLYNLVSGGAKISDIVDNVLNSIGLGFENAWKTVKTWLFGEEAAEGEESSGGAIKAVTNWFTNFGTSIYEGATQVIDTARKWCANMWFKFWYWLAGSHEEGRDGIDGAADIVWKWAKNTWMSIKDNAGKLIGIIQKNGYALWTTIKYWLFGSHEEGRDGIDGAVDIVWKWAKNMWSMIKTEFPKVVDAVATWGKAVWNGLQEWLWGKDTDKGHEDGAVKAVTEWAKSLLNSIVTNWPKVVDAVKSWGSKLWKQLKDAVFGVEDELGNRSGGLDEIIYNWLTSLKGKVLNARDAVKKLWPKVKKWFKDSLEGVKRKLMGFSESQSVEGISIWDAIKNWALGTDTDGDGNRDSGNLLRRFGKWAGSLKDKIVDGLSNSKTGKAISKWWKSVTDNITLSGKSLTQLADKFSEWVKTAWTTVKEWFIGSKDENGNVLKDGLFVRIKNWVSEIDLSNIDVDGIANGALKLLKNIWELIKYALFGTSAKAEALDTVAPAELTLAVQKGIIETIGDAIASIDWAEVGNEIGSMASGAAAAIASILGQLWDGIVQYFTAPVSSEDGEKATTGFESRLSQLVSVFESIQEMGLGGTLISGVKSAIDGLSEIITYLFEELPWDDIYGLMSNLGSAFLAFSGGKLLNNGSKLMKQGANALGNLGNLFNTAGTNVTAIGTAMGNFFKELTGTADTVGTDISEKIGDFFYNVGTSLSDFTENATELSARQKRWNTIVNALGQIGDVFLKIAGSVLMLAAAAYLLANVDPIGMERMFQTLAAVVVAVILTVAALGYFKVNTVALSGLAAAFVAIGISVLILTGVIALLGYVINVTAWETGLERLALIMGGLTFAMHIIISSLSTVNGLAVVGAALLVVTFTVAIGILIAEAMVLGYLAANCKELLVKGMVALVVIGAALVFGIGMLCDAVTGNFSGKKLIAAGLLAIMLAATLTMLMVPIAILTVLCSINETAVFEATGVVGVLCIFIAAAIGLICDAVEGNFSSKKLLVAAALMIVLTVCIAALVALVAVLTGLLAVNEVAVFEAMAVIVVLGVLLAAAVGALCNAVEGNFSSKKLLVAAALMIVLTACIGALVAMVYALTLMGDTTTIWHAVGQIVVLGILVTAIAYLCTVIGKKSKEMFKGIAGLALCTLVLAALVGVVYLVGQIKNIEKAVVSTLAIEVLLLALIGVCSVAGAASTLIIKGAAALAAVLVILAVAIIAVAGILASGFASASNDLLKATNTLSHVCEGFDKLDSESLQNGVDVVYIVRDIFDAFLSIDTTGYDTVAPTLLGLGAKIRLLNNMLSNVNDISASVTLAESIATIYTKLGEVGSSTDYTNLATSIADMGAALMLFAEETATGEVTDQSLENGKRIGDVLTSLANNLPDNSVLKQLTDLAGDAEGSNMTQLSLGIVGLATALSDYSEAAKKIDLPAVLLANVAMNQLVSTVNAIKPITDAEDAVWDWVLTQLGAGQQEDKISQFVTAITELGTGLATFASSFEDVDLEKAQSATGIADVLIDLQKKLFDSTACTGGVWAWITQSQSFSTFGQEIENLATYLAGFATTANGAEISSEKVATALDMIESLAGIQEKIGVFNKTSSLRIGDLTYDLKWVPSNLQTFYNDMANVKWGNCTSEDIANVVSILTDFAGVQALIGQFSVSNLRLKDLGYDLTLLPSNLQTFSNEMQNVEIDNDAIGNLADELSAIGESYYSFVATVAAATNSISGLKTNAYNSGVFIAQGVIDGLAEGTNNVYQTAYGLGLTAIYGLNAGADIHSPSKKAFESGMYVDMGMANGLAQYSGLVMKAGEEVSRDTLDHAQSLVDQFSSTLTASMDDQPVIRPVLDLTNLQNGESLISNMLGGNYGINSGYVNTPYHLSNPGQNYIGNTSYSNNDLGNAVSVLSEKVNQLGDKILGMQLVLDSGELVGGIAEQMDNELGARTARKVRGN